MEPAETNRLERYLQQRFNTETLQVRAIPGHPAAGVYEADEFLGVLTRDEDEGEVSYDFVMTLEGGDAPKMTAWELSRLQQVLAERLNDPKIDVRARQRKDDSAEVYSGEEFLGVLFLGTEEDEEQVSFNMGILDMDLDEMLGSA